MALAATVDARQVAPGAGHTTPPRIGSCDHRPRGDGSHPHLPAERRQRGEINELCAGGVRVFCLSPRKRAGPPAPADQTIVRSGGIEGTRCRHCRVRKTDPSVRGKTRSGSRDWLCLCLIWADADPRTMLSLSRLTPRSDWRRHQRALCFLTHVLLVVWVKRVRASAMRTPRACCALSLFMYSDWQNKLLNYHYLHI